MGCLVYCVGIIHTSLLDHFEDSMYLLSWIGSISSSLVALPGFTKRYVSCYFLDWLDVALLGPLSSYLMSRFSCRVATMIGGLLVAIGCFVSAFSSSLTVMILCYGLITGDAALVVVGLGFQKKRNFASGLAVAGIGVGMFCLSPVITAANNTYGYTGLFLILSGIGLHICLFGALFRPSYLENLGKDMLKRKALENSTTLFSHLKFRLRIFQKPSFLFFCFSILCWNIGLFIVFLHLPSYVMLKHTSRFEASFLLSIAGICSCVSRIVTGYISTSDRINEIIVYSVSFGVLGSVTLVFPYINLSYVTQVFYSIILGLFFGNCYAIMNSINVKIVGIENLPTAYGIEMCFCGFGMLVGPPLAGFIIENGGTYMTSFIIAERFHSSTRALRLHDQLCVYIDFVVTFLGLTIILGSVLGVVTFCCNRKMSRDFTTITSEIPPQKVELSYSTDVKQTNQECQSLMTPTDTSDTITIIEENIKNESRISSKTTSK
ncbi:hypothetical protein KUTeg_005059 [Tegillarca granosa]|uniref:Uncharacterized protein n=1 Tax=Tegillarca granosa TaxID=220873 RepID=A0ABQ9FLK0_TEGGR|nr:hypothetical protein KUTeg_005059 [Tegillarca granosa]